MITLQQLIAALNTRDMWINPHMFDRAADEIDCGPGCPDLWLDEETGARTCHRRGNCPNDLAETLREVAKIARQA